jgi:hypothetical protein
LFMRLPLPIFRKSFGGPFCFLAAPSSPPPSPACCFAPPPPPPATSPGRPAPAPKSSGLCLQLFWWTPSVAWSVKVRRHHGHAGICPLYILIASLLYLSNTSAGLSRVGIGNSSDSGGSGLFLRWFGSSFFCAIVRFLMQAFWWMVSDHVPNSRPHK